jgi:hypothetical protein
LRSMGTMTALNIMIAVTVSKMLVGFIAGKMIRGFRNVLLATSLLREVLMVSNLNDGCDPAAGEARLTMATGSSYLYPVRTFARLTLS